MSERAPSLSVSDVPPGPGRDAPAPDLPRSGTPLRGLLTHENPDLDATLSLWLLRRFGGARYPGVSELPVQFVPAGRLPDDLPPDVLEQTRGLLAVDTGGGRLDTHARDGVIDPSRQGKCAALLVAEDLGVAEDPALGKLLQFVTQQEISGRSIASREPMDHLVSLPNLARGLNLRYYDQPEKVLAVLSELYDAAYATEVEWFQALEDYKQALTATLSHNQARLVAVASGSGAVLRVARMHKADLILHRNAHGHTGITGRHTGALARLDLVSVARVLRTAEVHVAGTHLAPAERDAPGLFGGWYLHDSGRILSKGSAKNREVPPSQLPLGILLELTHSALDPTAPLPERFCAVRRKAGGCDGCAFSDLQLAACARLRRTEF